MLPGTIYHARRIAEQALSTSSQLQQLRFREVQWLFPFLPVVKHRRSTQWLWVEYLSSTIWQREFPQCEYLHLDLLKLLQCNGHHPSIALITIIPAHDGVGFLNAMLYPILRLPFRPDQIMLCILDTVLQRLGYTTPEALLRHYQDLVA